MHEGKSEGVMPAWLVCDGILSKARDELISAAIRTMHEQVEKKRLSLEGQPLSANESTSEQEKDRFFLEQLMHERENMERTFEEQIENASIGEKDRARIDEMQKFLLAIKQIAVLYRFSSVCGDWLVDAEKELREAEPDRLLARTAAKGAPERTEALSYLIKSKELSSERVFTDQERKIMERALEIAGAATKELP